MGNLERNVYKESKQNGISYEQWVGHVKKLLVNHPEPTLQKLISFYHNMYTPQQVFDEVTLKSQNL